jgi:hypothetical protein
MSHEEIVMSFKENHPEFAAIEAHVTRARLDRAVDLAESFARAARALGTAAARAAQRLNAVMERGYNAELDRRAVEADAFLRRSMPRY